MPGVRFRHDAAGHRHVGELPGMPHGTVPADRSPPLVTRADDGARGGRGSTPGTPWWPGTPTSRRSVTARTRPTG